MQWRNSSRTGTRPILRSSGSLPTNGRRLLLLRAAVLRLAHLACAVALAASGSEQGKTNKDAKEGQRMSAGAGAGGSVCKGVLAKEAARCAIPEAACGCRYTAKANGASRFAVIISGGLQTFAVTSFSLKKFILDMNAPIDVFVFGVYGPGRPQGIKNLEAVKEIATAYIIEPFTAVPQADPNDKHVPLRMLWQWEAIGHAFNLSQTYADGRGRRYDLVMRTRPDNVYFTALNITSYLASYREKGLYHPYWATYMWGKVDPELEAAVPRPYLQSGAQPMFTPPCDYYGGVSDKLWMASEETMALLLTPDFYIRFRTMNKTAGHELQPLAVDLDYQFAVGHGFEHLLGEWLRWHQVPVVAIPADGPDVFAWGVMRPDYVAAYCDGGMREAAYWTHKWCALNGDFSETEALQTPEAQHYCQEWKDGVYDHPDSADPHSI